MTAHPFLELSDVFREHGDAYRRAYRHSISVQQDLTLREISLCRTAELGGHMHQCDACEHQTPSYNSCRNRHCPKCSPWRREQWGAARASELLPVPYLHAVFTLPDELARIGLQNPKIVYGRLFQAASMALLQTAEARHRVQLGLVILLHTWGQRMNNHPHCHVFFPAGGISLTDGKWSPLPLGKHISNVGLPKEELRKRFQKIFLRRLKGNFRRGELVLEGELAHLKSPATFAKLMDRLAKRRWIIFARQAVQAGEPDHPDHAKRTLSYLARYVGGVVIGNRRLIEMADGNVSFSYKDYPDGGRRKEMKLPALEFCDRFLSHVLPRGMKHVRHYGFLCASKRKQNLAKLQQELGAASGNGGQTNDDQSNNSGEAVELEIPETDERTCPRCRKGRMQRIWESVRPTIPEILSMPFPGEQRYRQQRLAFESAGFT